jgi:hypothetical protein
MLHPDFPIVEGRYQMTPDWAVTLPQQFNRRIEDNSLVLWRPGITAWTVIWNNNNKQSQSERLEWLRSEISPDAFDAESFTDGDVTRFSYRLTERRDEEFVHALYGFAIGVNGHVQLVIYFDDEADLETARAIFRSVEEVPPKAF